MKVAQTVLIWIFLMISLPIWASTYFVSQSGSGSGDGKTYANRASVGHHNAGRGVFADLAGDTVVLCGRIRTAMNTPDSGSAGNEIVYDGQCSTYGGLDANVVVTDRAGFTCDEDHIVFRWLEFSGGDTVKLAIWITESSDYIYVRNSYFHDNIQSGIRIDGATFVTIGGAIDYSNIFEDIGSTTADEDIALTARAAEHQENTVISYNELRGDKIKTGVDGIMCNNNEDDEVDGVIIEHNYIHGHRRENAIDFKGGTNISIRKNIIKGNEDDTDPESIIHLQMGVSNVNIYGNIISDSFQSAIAVFDKAAEGRKTQNIFIWSNLIFEVDDSGVSLKKNGDGVENVYIWNNTIVNNALNPSNDGNCGLQIVNDIEGVVMVKNNIFQNNRNAAGRYKTRQVYSNDLNVIWDYNQYASDQGSITIYRRGLDVKFNEWQERFENDRKGGEASITFSGEHNNNFVPISNPIPAENIGKKYHVDSDLGLAEGTKIEPVRCGNTPGGYAHCAADVYLVDRDDYNDGNWGKGAFVYGSGDPSGIDDRPEEVRNLRIKK